MATETAQRGTTYDGRLFELYTKYVSEPESKKDVYGYTLLVVGYLFAMVGILVFILSPAGSGGEDATVWFWTKVVTLPMATGLVFTLVGIVLLLPVRRLSIYVTAIGALVALGAVGLFSVYYPYNWVVGSPSYSTEIIAMYTIGTAIVVGVVVMVPVITGERSYFSETAEGHEFDHPDIMVGDADHGGLFAVFKDGPEWTWRFIDQSAVATSNGSYLSQLEAEDRIEAVKDQVAEAGLLEIKHAAFRIYEADESTWQWYLMRDDGSAVAEGGHDYDSRDRAEAAINAMKDHGPSAESFVMEDGVYETYREEGEWGWRLVDEDRTPLALGTDTHAEREAAAEDLEHFRDLSAEATDLIVESYGVELREVEDSWQWHLRDSAHRELATSEVRYEAKGVAEDAVYDLLEELQDASIVDAEQPTYDVYETGRGWAWRFVDETGETLVTDRTESDASAGAAEAAAEHVRKHAANADVVEMADLEFETYRSGGEWHWRLVAGTDREVRARSTEPYESEETASAVVDRIRDEAPEADLLEFDSSAFQIYEAAAGAWRWRLIDEDGTVMADSGQGEYDSKGDAMSAMTTLQENAPEAEHLEIENAAFELFEDEDGWGWRLVDDIGDTLADGTTRHETEEGARQAMNDLIDSVSDVDERRMADGIYQIYADDEDQWWWQFVLPDGTVVADAEHSYATRHAAEDAIEDLRQDAATAPIERLGQLAILLDPDDWSWTLVDADRDPVAAGVLTHEDRDAAMTALADLQAAATETTVYEIREAAFDCYETDEGWTWRLVDDDHETIGRSPTTHDRIAPVEDAIAAVSRLAPEAEFFDYDEVAFELYQAADSWTWQLVDEDQQPLAVAASTYESRRAAEADLNDARGEITDASVIEIDSAAFEFNNTDDGWQWRLVDQHGDELAYSLETFESRAEAQTQLSTIKDLGPEAWISFAE